MIRLLIADDHPVVREGLSRIVSSMPGVRVVAECGDGDAVVANVKQHELEAVLMDITMPGPGFIEVLRQLRELKPRLPVLILSVHPEEQFATRALRAGAAGYLTKNHSPDQLKEALAKVLRGGKYISPALADRLANSLGPDFQEAPHEALSEREFEALRLLGAGMTARAAAEKMQISPKTVSTYRDRIREKLKLSNNAEIVKYAVERGLS